MDLDWAKKTNFYFTSDLMNAREFMYGQLCCNSKLFVVYKTTVSLLSWCAFTFHVYTYPDKIKYFLYIQHWVEILVNIYLFFSLLCVFYGFYKNYKIKSQNSRRRYSNRSTRNKRNSGSSGNYEKRRGWELFLIHQITWLLYEVGCCTSLTICVVYWTFLDSMLDFYNLEISQLLQDLYIYAVLVTLMTVESLMCRYQTTFLHFIYTYVYGLIYMFFNCIIYVLKKSDVLTSSSIPINIYWYTSWEDHLSWTILLCLGMLPVVMCLQMYLIGIHAIRDYWCARKGLPKIEISQSVAPTLI